MLKNLARFIVTMVALMIVVNVISTLLLTFVLLP